jgi:predicted dehydrogenase
MKISLAGCGRWGRNILRDLLELGVQVSVADPDPEARSYAASLGVDEVLEDLDMLGDADGIVIAVPTSIHSLVIDQALHREVPVFVEKPLAPDAAAARALAERGRGRLFVMDKWRYHTGIEELRRIREAADLGTPHGMHLRHVGWGHPHKDVDVVWILLPHCLSILLEVFGELPEPNYAFAERLDGKVVGLTGTLGTRPWATFEVSARSPVKRREFRLHCEDGVAWLDDGWSSHIQISRGNDGAGADASSVEKRTVVAELPLMRELKAFLEFLRGGTRPRSSAEEGALIVERVQQLRTLAGIPA